MSQEVKELLVAHLEPLEHLLREDVDDDYIRELAVSITEHGLLNPITVRPWGDGYQIVAGWCRWKAHQWMGRETIPARVVECSDQRVYAMAAIENIQRVDLSPVEEARTLKHIIEGGEYTVKEIARMLSKSDYWVRSRVETLTWPPNFIEALSARLVGLGALRELVQIGDVEYRDYLLEIACHNGVTRNVALSWRLSWEQTQMQLPVEEIECHTPGVDRPPVVLTMPCWGCQQPYDPGEISYKPLCPDCVGLVTPSTT